jgi:transcriptional regulator with XRE-family HTH domain
MKTSGAVITERRKELSLSQKELAALIKNRDGQPLSTPYLSDLENGRGVPPAYLLDQLAKGVRIVETPTELVNLVDQRDPITRPSGSGVGVTF